MGSLVWPPVGYENVPWDVHPRTGMSRRERASVGQPYSAAMPPSIARLEVVIPGTLAALAEEAATAVAAFDAEMGHQVAPFAGVLLRSESASSSQIEHLSASARRIAEAEIHRSGTEHAQQIVGNVHAMESALNNAHHLDSAAVLTMHRALMFDTDPEIAGHWREDQVWIGGPRRLGAGSPHDADVVPPVASRVPDLMHDLMEFVARDDLPVLPQAAIAHAQFETIHPFPDGNGRTGRALLQAMLRAKGLTRHVSVPVSAGLLSDTRVYFAALDAYRSGDAGSIVDCIARAAMLGVANGRELVHDLSTVRADWDVRLAGLRSDSSARRLADGLLRRPVITAAVARAILGTAKNEERPIATLVDRGVLRPHQDYATRNMSWRAQDVLDALDRYAARAGRRRP